MLSTAIPILLALTSFLTPTTSQSIDPSSVPKPTRESWCSSQKAACPLICLQLPGASGSPTQNTCSADTLAYSCICSNNVSPNASEYSQTMAYYICTEANNQCTKACSTNTCADACRSDHPCGAQDPKRVNVTTTSAAATTSTTMPSINTKEATGAATRFSLEMGHVVGSCALVGGFVAGFAILL
ncbi:uncharacterized protein N7469_002466 [Penicillium citrinum]|uniref:DUF7707 domain-containing protein n=2 Tax=Penicillium TaxID=5073 RepID=A0A9W9PAI8_PENCI|nr:uncharacterized protein N7469_002466 [Penicillium citrinum]KAJ5240875.1 hypothetical protein N7469_002466 [Penicillium citrinum]KAJ5585871.1 hypothetical protein N7450_005658 [Penicillium hetheringtonii]